MSTDNSTTTIIQSKCRCKSLKTWKHQMMRLLRFEIPMHFPFQIIPSAFRKIMLASKRDKKTRRHEDCVCICRGRKRMVHAMLCLLICHVHILLWLLHFDWLEISSHSINFIQQRNGGERSWKRNNNLWNDRSSQYCDRELNETRRYCDWVRARKWLFETWHCVSKPIPSN